MFYENVILLAALSLLMIAVGLVKNFPILCLCAVPLLIVALVSPKLDREYITIDEWAFPAKRGTGYAGASIGRISPICGEAPGFRLPFH